MIRISSIVVFFFLSTVLFAQPLTESGSRISPRDGVFDKKVVKERRALAQTHIREADVLWSKRIWREIDVREKINQSFSYPESPLINILMAAVNKGEIEAYSTLDDAFTTALKQSEKQSMMGTIDTIEVFDPTTQQVSTQIVHNDLNPSDIVRFRIKEDWIFNTNTGRLEVYIIGIAPLKKKFDNNGNFLLEYPMYWIYYPEARQVLEQKLAYNPLSGNMGGQGNMTWSDIFENRLFSSYITKKSNVHARRIQDYKSGMDVLHESNRISSEMFAFEQDLWSY